MTTYSRLRRWITQHRLLLFSFCVGALLIFSFPFLLSTTWGGYCIQKLVSSITRFDIRWKKASISWFSDTSIQDLSFIDRRAQANVFIKRIDSTWRPTSLFSSPRSIGTTTINGAHVTFLLPKAKTEEWAYPLIPSSLPASRRSRLPVYGNLHIEDSRLTCKISKDQEITLQDVTASLLVPAKKGNIVCSLSASSAVEEIQEPGTLNLFVEYEPIKPRSLLRANRDALVALAENRLYVDAHIHHFPSLLLDTILRIRHPHNTALLSSAMGPYCDLRLQTTPPEATPHLAMEWNSPLLKGGCSIDLSDARLMLSTPQPIEWTLTPEFLAQALHEQAPFYIKQLALHNPLVLKLGTPELIIHPREDASGEHLNVTGAVSAQMAPLTLQLTPHTAALVLPESRLNVLFTPGKLDWDAQIPLVWEKKHSRLASSGNTLLSLGLDPAAIRQMKLGLETVPIQLIELLLKQKGKIEPLIGDTATIHFSMQSSESIDLPKDSTHFMRLVCLTPKLECSPIEIFYGTNLTLLKAVQFQLIDPLKSSKWFSFSCDTLTSSALAPCEAKFTLPIGRLSLSLSTLPFPHAASSPLKLAGQVAFSPYEQSLAENAFSPFFGSVFTCAFSTAYDPKDVHNSFGEFFIKGEGLEGSFTCKWLNDEALDLTSSNLIWKIKPQHLATLQTTYPFLKDWALYEEATCILTTQKGPLPFSLKRLKEEGRAFSMHIDSLPLLHIPTHTKLPIKLQGFLNENMHARMQGFLPVREEGMVPTFMLEGSLKNTSNINAHFTANQIPTSLLQIPLNAQQDVIGLSTWLMGSHCTFQGSFATTPQTRHGDIHLTSASGFKMEVNATQQMNAMRYILNRPCKLSVPLSLFTRPIPPAILADKKRGLSRLFKFAQQIKETKGNLSFTLFPEMASLRLPFRSWEDVEFSKMAVEIGEVTLNTPSTKSALSTILHKAIQARKLKLSIRATPLFLSLQQGKLRLKRFDVLIAGRYPIALWGRFKIPKNHIKATLAISATALRAGYGLSDITPGYFLLLPMSGKPDDISLHKTKALTRLTALSLHSGGGIPGAFLGSFAHWLGGGFDPSQIPPPTSQIPWAYLDEELKAEELEMAQKQGNSLPGTLIAPIQAVHRGIQTSVRKGSDLLFNMLRLPKRAEK